MVSAKWRHPLFVKDDGTYIMTRTDDTNQFLVTVVNGYITATCYGTETTVETPVKDYDHECRFFGPIPDCNI